jgi:REP element-mobilizing transposase RayT
MYDPERHHRRSVRLRDVRYTEPGGYFVTVCTRDRGCLFGEVVDGEMRLNVFGEIAEECWLAIPVHFPVVQLDAFVVMPNHVHGVIGIIGEGIATYQQRRGATCCAPTTERINVEAGSLGAMVRSFKSPVTKQINAMRGTPGVSVWQRGYWDRIIRNERELERIRRYIAENPARWVEDRYYEG